MPAGLNYNPFSAATTGALADPLHGGGYGSGRGRFGPTDHQRRLAQALIQSGTDTSPVQGHGEGAGRVAKALIGALLFRNAGQADQEQQQGIANTVGQAVRAGQPTWTVPAGGTTEPPAMPSDVGPFQPGAGPLPPGAQMLAPGETVPIPGATGGVQAMARVLAENPNTAPTALRLTLGSAVADQERAANAAAEEKRLRLAQMLRGPQVTTMYGDDGREQTIIWNPNGGENGQGGFDKIGGTKAPPIERPQAPHIATFVDDETGQLSTKQYNPKTGQWDRIGGAKQGAGSGAGGLSTAQQRLNDETDEARLTLDQLGLSREDLLRKSQPTSATGRPNPDYDNKIGTLVTKATRRKYGDDPQHSRYLGGVHGVQPQGGQPTPGAPPAAPGVSPGAAGFNPGSSYGPTSGTSVDPKAGSASGPVAPQGGLQNLPAPGLSAAGDLPYLPTGQLDMSKVRPNVTYSHPQFGRVRFNPQTGNFESVE